MLEANLGNTSGALESYRKALALLGPAADGNADRKVRMARVTLLQRLRLTRSPVYSRYIQ